jgi:hypothetical protein
MEGCRDVVGCGGGLEPEEDVERAPVVLMTPVGFSPKGKCAGPWGDEVDHEGRHEKSGCDECCHE